MRTELVYSIIAAAAIPVTANAAASGYVAESNLLITGGTAQSIELGKIAKGQYKLVSQPILISSDNALKVEVWVDGVKQTQKSYNATNEGLDLEFSANGKVDVELRFLNLVTTYEVRIEGVSADLTLDFEALAGDLQTMYNHLENEFNFYTFDNVDYWQGRKGEIQSKILQIKKIADDQITGKDAYDIYNALGLSTLWVYGTGWVWDKETSVLFDEIAQLRSDMKDYEVAMLTQPGNDFEQAQDAYNALPDYDKKDKDGNDTELAEKYNIAKHYYSLLSGTPSFEDIQKYVQALTDLQEALDAAEQALDDNNAAAAVMLADAEKYYNETVDYFQELMPEYTGRHNDLYENALADIQPLKDAINAVYDAQAAGTAATDAAKLQAAIDAAKAKVPAVINKYKEYAPKLIAALETLDAQADLVNATLESTIETHTWIVADEKFEEVMYQDYAALDPEQAALEDAYQALADFIEANDTKDKLDQLADLSAYTKAIADADKAMKDKAANYQAYEDLMQTVVLLELEAYNDGAEVKAYAYNATDDPDNPGKGLDAAEYDVEDLWQVGTNDIIAKYPAIIDAINANKEDIAAWKKTKDFNDQYTTPFTELSVEVVNLKANAMAAIDIYADNKANLKAINELIAYLKAEVEAKGLDIWNEEVIGNEYTPYGKKIKEIKKKGLEIQAYLTESLNHKTSFNPKKADGSYDEECHLGYLLKNIPDGKDALTDDVAALENMKENIEEYEQAYKDQRDAQAIQNIKDNILALVNDYTNQIQDALLDASGEPFDFDPIQDKVDEALKEIIDLMEADVEVAMGDSDDKDYLTAVYEELKAADEYVLVDGKLVNILQDALDKIDTYKKNVTALNATIDPLVNFDWDAMAEAILVADPDDTYFTAKLQDYKDNIVPELIAKIKGREDPAEWSAHATRDADRAEVIAMVNEIFNLDDLAYDNGQAWKAALDMYGIAVDHEYTDLEPFYGYDQAMVEIENYPSSELENQKAVLNKFKDQFDELKAAADESHANGTATTTGEEFEIAAALAEMNAKMKTWTSDAVYDAQILADNQAAYQSVLKAETAAKAASKNAAEALKGYLDLKSTEMKAAKADAEAEFKALNDMLYTYNDKLKEIGQRALNDYNATVSPDRYNVDGAYEAEYQALIDEVNTLLEAFIDKFNEVAAQYVEPSLDAYASAIASSKDTAKKYSADDKDLPAKDITKAYKTVDGMLAVAEDAWEMVESIEVRILDEALYDAEQAETGIVDQLPPIEEGLAKKALETLTGQVDALAAKYLSADDQKTLQDIKDGRTADGYTYSGNFDIEKPVLMELLAKAKAAQKDDQNIQKGEAAMADAQAALDAAYATLDNYAAGSQLIASLDAIQAEIDAYEVTLSNWEVAIEDAKSIKAEIAGIVGESLYDAELPILKDLLEQAKTQYPAYAASAADADAVKAAIEKAEKDIAAIEKVAAEKGKDHVNAVGAMPTVEKNLTNLIAKMKDFNDTDFADKALFNSLKDEIDALGYDLSAYDAAVVSELADDTDAIDKAIADAKTYLNNHENDVATYEDNIRAKIAEIEEAIDELYKKAEEVKAADTAAWEAAAEYYFADAAEMFNGESLWYAQNLYNLTQETLEAFGAANKYKNKMAQLQKLIDAQLEIIAEAKAAAEELTGKDKFNAAIDTWYDALHQLWDIQDDLLEILNAATNTYADVQANDLQQALDTVWAAYDKDNYTDGDEVKLETAKAEIQDHIDNFYTLIASAIADAEAALEPGEMLLPPQYKEIIDALTAEINDEIAALKQMLKELAFAEDVRGHVSGNDDISSDDLMDLADIILNGEEDTADKERCDVNGDGEIDVTDLVWLRYYLVHGYWPDEVIKAPAMDLGNAANSIAMQVISTANGVSRVAVNLTNETTFQAFQLNMQLPAGAKVVGQSLGERVEGANLMTSKATEGNVRFVGLSYAKNTFAGNDGAVMYIDIENLNGEITLESAIFTDTALNGVDLVNGNGTTGIKDTITNALEAAGQKIYNLSGKMMNGLKKGVNILRGEDGKSKKVVVK